MRVTATSREDEHVNQVTSTGPDEAQRILDVVAEILGERGYKSLQLRHVASRAHLSLSTIYGYYPSKDELVVAAVERWMQERVYAGLPTPEPDAPLSERLTLWYRELLAPWERDPAMLRVFLVASMLPGGERLSRQGADAVLPSSQQMYDGYDPGLAEDVNLILANVVFGLLGQFANGQIDMTDMIAVVERAIYRLTGDARLQPS